RLLVPDARRRGRPALGRRQGSLAVHLPALGGDAREAPQRGRRRDGPYACAAADGTPRRTLLEQRVVRGWTLLISELAAVAWRVRRSRLVKAKRRAASRRVFTSDAVPP